MGPFAETTTFLEHLPEKAMERDVVARVEIQSQKMKKISTKIGGKIIESDSEIQAEVKVIESLKGVAKGSILKVVVALTSCSREPHLAPSQKYYLAGTIGNDKIFRGEWRVNALDSK